MAIKSKIKSALMYPIAVLVVAFVVVTVIMIFVIPAFKEVFKSFGADLPAPTLASSRCRSSSSSTGGRSSACSSVVVYFFFESWKRSRRCRCSWTACCCVCRSSAT
jgi:type IV pilus assembly protein PilC